MIKIKIIAVGSLKERYLELGIQEYLKRLSRFAEVSIEEVDEKPIEDASSKKLVDQMLQTEANKILSLMPKQAYVIVTDILGKTMTSEQIANKIGQLQQQTSQLVLIIGGSNGIHESVKKLAKEKWSFSALTFPHQLFRLLLLEQLYRSMTLLAGHPYHK
jgi:23S rRNA (pseudouridine1915-N3)-methyltransferase